jgi:hypothetical protein
VVVAGAGGVADLDDVVPGIGERLGNGPAEEQLVLAEEHPGRSGCCRHARNISPCRGSFGGHEARDVHETGPLETGTSKRESSPRQSGGLRWLQVVRETDTSDAYFSQL